MIRALCASLAIACTVACGSSVPEKVSVNQPPIPVLDVATTAKVGDAVHVDASKSNDTDGAVHDAFVLFGDGSSPAIISDSPTFSADHTYTTAGLYLIELYVDDDKGASSRARVRIQVTP